VNGAVPGRLNAVFAGLVVATCVTWWLGSESALTGGVFELAATLTILIAFVKISFIGADFMELRAAPIILRAVFFTWVAAFAAAAIAMVVV
jgi:hypothetical protein